LGHPLLETERYLERLTRLVEREAYDLVIPSADETLLPVMQVADELRLHARLAAPDIEGFASTFYKDRTVALARHVGIPVPRTCVLHHERDLIQLEGWESFPAVLKPASSVSCGSSSRKSVRVSHSPDQTDQFLSDMLREGSVLVQEFCRGHGVGMCVLADNGRLVAAFQHRRVHEPPGGGAASYRQSEPLSVELLDDARRFCAAISWTGPAMFEYKRNPDTGRHTLMEVNGRFWGSLALSIQSGVDFPKLLYDMFVTGHSPEVFTYRVPYFVRHTCRDLYWFQANLRTPRHSPDRMKLRLSDVAKEIGNILRRREGYDLESLSDPRPALCAWRLTSKEIACDVRDKVKAGRQKLQAAKLVREARRRLPKLRGRIRECRSILFVCTGNINRSAVAERSMKDWIGRRGLCIETASAGLLEPAGRSTSLLSLEVAAELGVDLANHRSQVLTGAHLHQFDFVAAMDGRHLAAIAAMSSSALERTFLLGELDAQREEDGDAQIPDPYGKDRAAFRDAYARIVRSVQALTSLLDPERETSASTLDNLSNRHEPSSHTSAPRAANAPMMPPAGHFAAEPSHARWATAPVKSS
jgi:protein-tyrosine-phosphatase